MLSFLTLPSFYAQTLKMGLDFISLVAVTGVISLLTRIVANCSMCAHMQMSLSSLIFLQFFFFYRLLFLLLVSLSDFSQKCSNILPIDVAGCQTYSSMCLQSNGLIISTLILLRLNITEVLSWSGLCRLAKFSLSMYFSLKFLGLIFVICKWFHTGR